jgi:hypothetical protein
VSLILEALRKLEKEKQAPERGFLIVAASSWPAATRRAPLWIGAGAVGACLLAGAALWLWPRERAVPARPSRSRPVETARPAAPDALVPPPGAGPTRSSRAPASTVPAAPALASPASLAPRPRPRVEPHEVAAPSPPALVLQAISARDGRPIAIVSDHLVHEGDAFDGVTIVRIGEAEVEVEWGGTRRILHF